MLAIEWGWVVCIESTWHGVCRIIKPKSDVERVSGRNPGNGWIRAGNGISVEPKYLVQEDCLDLRRSCAIIIGIKISLIPC
jgi:hypothetical protein